MDRYVVISSDCHAGALPAVYREHLDSRYRDEYDRWVPHMEAWIKSFLPVSGAADRVSHQDGANVTLFMMPAEREKEYREAVDSTNGDLGNWDPDVRIRDA